MHIGKNIIMAYYFPFPDTNVTIHYKTHYAVSKTKYCWAIFILASTLHQNQQTRINQKRESYWH